MRDTSKLHFSAHRIIEAAREGVWVIDRRGRTRSVNARMAEMLGCRPEELHERSILEFLAEGAQCAEKPHCAPQHCHPDRPRVLTLRRRDGLEFRASVSTSTIGADDGRVLATVLTVADLTEREGAEAALRAQSRDLGERVKELDCINRLSALLEDSRKPWNELLAEMVRLIPPGWQYPEITAAHVELDGIGSASSEGFTETPWTLEQEVRIDGTRVGRVNVCYLEQRPSSQEGPFLEEERNLIGVIAAKAARLIERERAKTEIERRVRQQAAVARLGREVLHGRSVEALCDIAVRITSELVGVEFAKVLELSPNGHEFRLIAGVGWDEGLIGTTCIPNEPGLLPGYTLRAKEPVIIEDRRSESRVSAPDLLCDHDVRSAVVAPIASADRDWGVFAAHAREPRAFSEHDVNFMQSMANVIADAMQRAHTERAIQQNRMLEEVAGRMARVGGWLLTIGEDRAVLSDQACAISELPPGSTLDRQASLRLTAPEHAARMSRALRACVDDGVPYDEEVQLITATGRRLWVRAIGEPVRDAHGRVTHVRGATQDITARKEQDDALRQAQKMEAVGRLAGGIAHDFNNTLMVILGHAEMLVDGIEQDAALRAHAQGIMRSGEQAAHLTRRLLAYSRRQTLEAGCVDLNGLIEEITQLLVHALGADIRIELSLAEALWPIGADKAQVESSLLNLAINARDAMPEGGCLRIETCNRRLAEHEIPHESGLESGDYVSLMVTDTGTGMAAETVARAFDPFFTTKAPGKGTGLGLSSFLGFVKQSGGHVDLHSAPGSGTSVHVLLPRLTGPVSEDDTPQQAAPAGRQETVLLVEDEQMVRELLAMRLRMLGYEVLEAACGSEAIDLLERHGTITLLLSDVIMPGGMDGPQLVAAARERQPSLKVVLTSGYSEMAERELSSITPPVPVLKKPFRKAELAGVLRNVIDGGA